MADAPDHRWLVVFAPIETYLSRANVLSVPGATAWVDLAHSTSPSRAMISTETTFAHDPRVYCAVAGAMRRSSSKKLNMSVTWFGVAPPRVCVTVASANRSPSGCNAFGRPDERSA